MSKSTIKIKLITFIIFFLMLNLQLLFQSSNVLFSNPKLHDICFVVTGSIAFFCFIVFWTLSQPFGSRIIGLVLSALWIVSGILASRQVFLSLVGTPSTSGLFGIFPTLIISSLLFIYSIVISFFSK